MISRSIKVLCHGLRVFAITIKLALQRHKLRERYGGSNHQPLFAQQLVQQKTPLQWKYHRSTSPVLCMMTSSNGNIFRVTGHLCGEFTGHRGIPRTKASDAELWCYLDLHLNKRLSKQSWGWWFETLSRSLWRHGNGSGNGSLSQRARYEESVPMSWRHSGQQFWYRSLQLTSVSHLNNYNHATCRLKSPGTRLFLRPGEVYREEKSKRHIVLCEGNPSVSMEAR